jgi:hypothetical protein
MRFFFIVKCGFIEMILGSLRGLNLGGLIVQSSFFPSPIMPDILLCPYGNEKYHNLKNSSENLK